MATVSENLLGRNAMTGSIASADTADNIVNNATQGEPLAPNPLAGTFADPITLREQAIAAGVSEEEIDKLTPNDLVFAIRTANGDIR